MKLILIACLALVAGCAVKGIDCSLCPQRQLEAAQIHDMLQAERMRCIRQEQRRAGERARLRDCEQRLLLP